MPRQPPDTGRRATLRDVATALGVSIATVSNAFNRPDQLSTALREQVLAEAARQGLTAPNPAARSLHTGRPRSIGVIYTDRLSYAFSDPAAVLFLTGVTEECEQAGVELVLIPHSSTQPPERTSVGRSLIDGLIVYSVADDDPVLAAAHDRALPVVLVDQPAWNGTDHWVGIDEEAGARAVCRHVLALGHRELAVVSTEINRARRGGPVGPRRRQAVTFASTAARLRGYRAAIEEAGLPWSAVTVHEAVENTTEQGRRAAKALLRGPSRPTAVLAMTDQLAIGALRAAADAGLRVPGDLSIAGFDDIPAAADQRPPLTTVHQPHREKGRQAAHHILRVLAGDSSATTPTTLRHELRERGSTARVRAARLPSAPIG